MKKLKSRIFMVIIIILSLVGVSCSSDEEEISYVKAEVINVYDGDTITVLIDGKKEKIRFIGIDTPEIKPEEAYGKEAASYAKVKLKGETVYLTYDVEERDKYDRMLAYVWTEKPYSEEEDEIRDKMFNADLLFNGYAKVMTIQPNSKYADIFVKYQSEAKDTDKGLWGEK